MLRTTETVTSCEVAVQRRSGALIAPGAGAGVSRWARWAAIAICAALAWGALGAQAAHAVPKSVSGWLGGDLVGSGPPAEANGGLLSLSYAIGVNVAGNGAAAGDVYVAEFGFDRVQQFSADGEFVRAWGLDVVMDGRPNDQGTGYEICDAEHPTTPNDPEDCKAGVDTAAPGGALSGPRGVAVDQATGDVFVSDAGNQRVQRFSATGEFIAAWGRNVVADGAPNDQPDDGFEVCDTEDPPAFPNDPEDCKAGEPGELAGELSTPRELAVVPAGASNAGNVLVAEQNNRRVQEFTPDGEFVRVWGKDVIVDEPGVANDNGTDFEVCDTGHPETPNDPEDCKAGIAAAVGEAGFSSSAPTAIAADASGAVYTADVFTGFRVRKFTPVGTPVADGPTMTHEIFAPGTPPDMLDGTGGTGQVDGPRGVAVGAGSSVFVARGGFDAPDGTCGGVPSMCERRVLEFDSAATLLEEHMVGSGIDHVNGVGANPDSGLLYVSSDNFGSQSPGGSATQANRVYILDELPPPTAEMNASDPVVGVSPYRATFQALVSSGARFYFEYKLPDDPDVPRSWSSVPSSEDAQAPDGGGSVAVFRSVTGLSPATDYDVRVVAKRPFTTLTETSAAVSFTTLDAPPTIRGVNATPFARSVRLSGGVIPNGSPTVYWFEYGLAPCSNDPNPCTAVPDPTSSTDGQLGDGSTVANRARRVEGLEPLTTYHYRMMASNNAAGVTAGADRTFTTAEPPAPAGRAYELVTPFDTGGADVQGPGLPLGRRTQWYPRLFNAAPDGERVSFTSWPDLPGSAPPLDQGRPIYRAQRDAGLGRWTSEMVAPPGDLIAEAFGGGAAEDLSAFYFSAGNSQSPTAGVVGKLHDDDPGPANDAYRREPDGSWSWVSRNSLLPVQDIDYRAEPLATSADGRTAVFVSREPLEPEADDVERAFYVEHPDGSRAEVVSIVDDGTVVEGSSPVLVSADGQRVGFAALGRYWMRLRGEDRTVEVTAPGAGGSRSGPAGLSVLGMARDGSAVFFESGQPLTGDDLDGEVDLFRFDVDAESLERISVPSALAPHDGQRTGSDCGPPTYGVPGCDVTGVLASDDGSTAYFLSGELLDEGAVRGEPNLYVHRGGETGLVGTLAGGVGADSDAGPPDEPQASRARPSVRDPRRSARPVRTTPDGRVLFFRSHAQLTAADNGGVAEAYVFDAATGAVRCASCRDTGDGLGPNLPARFETEVPQLITFLNLGLSPGRNLTSDGGRVYFDTEERLVARDVNGARDVYEYDVAADRLSLMSTGRHDQDSFYYDNSTHGRDVFFITREQLVAQDLNGSSMRIYDAREGGGLAAPPDEPACGEGECRGAPAAPPAFAPPPTTSDDGGAGNVEPRVRRRLAVRRPGRRALARAARSGRLAVAVRSNKAGRVRVRVVARIGRRVRRVGAARRRLRSAGRMRVVVRLSRPARRVLRARGRLRVRLVVGGPGARPARVGLTLRRAGR